MRRVPGYLRAGNRLMKSSVLATLLPTAFFAALDRGANSVTAEGGAEVSSTLVTDAQRTEMLHISRGIGIILLVV